jgi:hypothetical protein
MDIHNNNFINELLFNDFLTNQELFNTLMDLNESKDCKEDNFLTEEANNTIQETPEEERVEVSSKILNLNLIQRLSRIFIELNGKYQRLNSDYFNKKAECSDYHKIKLQQYSGKSITRIFYLINEEQLKFICLIERIKEFIDLKKDTSEIIREFDKYYFVVLFSSNCKKIKEGDQGFIDLLLKNCNFFKTIFEINKYFLKKNNSNMEIQKNELTINYNIYLNSWYLHGKSIINSHLLSPEIYNDSQNSLKFLFECFFDNELADSNCEWYKFYKENKRFVKLDKKIEKNDLFSGNNLTPQLINKFFSKTKSINNLLDSQTFLAETPPSYNLSIEDLNNQFKLEIYKKFNETINLHKDSIVESFDKNNNVDLFFIDDILKNHEFMNDLMLLKPTTLFRKNIIKEIFMIFGIAIKDKTLLDPQYSKLSECLMEIKDKNDVNYKNNFNSVILYIERKKIIEENLNKLINANYSNNTPIEDHDLVGDLEIINTIDIQEITVGKRNLEISKMNKVKRRKLDENL